MAYWLRLVVLVFCRASTPPSTSPALLHPTQQTSLLTALLARRYHPRQTPSTLRLALLCPLTIPFLNVLASPEMLLRRETSPKVFLGSQIHFRVQCLSPCLGLKLQAEDRYRRLTLPPLLQADPRPLSLLNMRQADLRALW